MTNNINTFWDTHVHIFSHRWINDDVYFGRYHMPAWAWQLIAPLRAAAKGLRSLAPDHVEALIKTAMEAWSVLVERLAECKKRGAPVVRIAPQRKEKK